MKNRSLYVVIAIVFVIKILASYFIPVVGDESYYWFWGLHPQLSYFDHPAMVAWINAINPFLRWLPISIGLRLPFVVLGTLSALIWVSILRRFYLSSISTLIWFLIFYNLNPLFGLGGVFVTPDVPLMFFWSLSYFFYHRIISRQKIIDYIFLGVFLGLGFCSKYHIVLFPIFLILSLALDKKLSYINIKKLSFTFLFGLIFSLPVIVWNYQNDWASFTFQINHGFSNKPLSLTNSLLYIVGQILLFNPVLFYVIIRNSFSKFDLKISFLQWLFFLTSSFRSTVEANWPQTSHAHALLEVSLLKQRFKKWALAYWVVVWLAIGIYLASPLSENKRFHYPTLDLAEKIWPEVKDVSPLYGPTYQLTSLLHLYSQKPIYKLPELSRHDFYDSAIIQKIPENSFYVLKYDISSWPEWMARRHIRLIKQIEPYKLGLYYVTLKEL